MDRYKAPRAHEDLFSFESFAVSTLRDGLLVSRDVGTLESNGAFGQRSHRRRHDDRRLVERRRIYVGRRFDDRRLWVQRSMGIVDHRRLLSGNCSDVNWTINSQTDTSITVVVSANCSTPSSLPPNSTDSPNGADAIDSTAEGTLTVLGLPLSF